MNKYFSPAFVFGFLSATILIAGLLLASRLMERSEKNISSLENDIIESHEIWPLIHELPDPSLRKPLRIQAVGDILLARDVGLRIRQNGWKHPFDGAAHLIKQGDLNFCNLETPASFIGSPYPGKLPNITFRANPGALFALKHAGFNLVSLANNHMTDYGAAALEETLDALSMLDIAWAGAGRNKQEAYSPAIIEIKGWRVALLSYAEGIWSVVEAGKGPGVAHIIPERIPRDIIKARTEEKADLVLISLHWGDEYSHRPRASQRALAKSLIDAGADTILGHHPHVMQGVEWHKGKPILYSLGNFAFDQIDDPTYQSMLARLDLGTDGTINLGLRPMRIARRSLHQTIPEGEDLKRIARNIISYCKGLGTTALLQDDGWISIPKPELGEPLDSE